jgi:hydrogenase maturation factor
MEFGEVESDVKDQTGIVGDVEFTDVGERKIQKGEYVLEHNVVKLVKVNQNMKREECKLLELYLEVYIGKLNIRTKMKCFNVWNKSGLMS